MSIKYRSFSMGDATCSACGIIIRVGIRGVKLPFVLTIFVLGLFIGIQSFCVEL